MEIIADKKQFFIFIGNFNSVTLLTEFIIVMLKTCERFQFICLTLFNLDSRGENQV